MAIGTIPITEAQFQKQVQDLAELNGWLWLHVERMGNSRGQWRTPMIGPLAPGFSDLMLLSRRTGRIIFVELKAQRGVLSESQKLFRQTVGTDRSFVFRPSDWLQIVETLANAH